MDLVRERHADFGPTFAREKLVDVHGCRLSVETLRKWMVAEGVWRAKASRAARAHQSRPRRECVGDLVRIDGSPRDWFEGRGPVRALIVHIDDAPTRPLALGFFAAETTEAHMETTRAHLAAHGRPVAYYSDRHGVFRVNKKDKLTQFSRALRTLDIAAIQAGSPRAKGRVEQSNQTPRDRLVNEMRLRGIGDMAADNAYLPEFMADLNRRFAVAPRNPADAHRAVLHDPRELDLIPCEHHARKLTKNPTVGFECRECQVTGRGMGCRPRGAAVTVCKAFDGSVTVLRDGRELPVRLLARGEEEAPVEDEKSVRPRVDRAKAEQRSRPTWKPATDHPWRQPFNPEATGVAAGWTARIGPGLRSLRSLRPRPIRPHRRSAVIAHENAVAQRGYFYFGEKGTFLLCVDTSPSRHTGRSEAIAGGSAGDAFDQMSCATLRRSLPALFTASRTRDTYS